ncbi:ATPase family AAA domain-containing protein FIGL1-like [Chenopodium quinoa]|uniref:ATPase family AAA domain-containing protein FIGL1-like n=1 Tax=Chenopodium quinoa TaxID=63459 RepID=UPI000B774BC6|nr:ATPase family AAA domain-containing protein FIGL1-like [Chenopodium quinoa]
MSTLESFVRSATKYTSEGLVPLGGAGGRTFVGRRESSIPLRVISPTLVSAPHTVRTDLGVPGGALWDWRVEKLVRALFGVASCCQPAVYGILEIQIYRKKALRENRKSEGEHEACRRLKTQFLIEMEGFDNISEQILLIGDCSYCDFLEYAELISYKLRLYEKSYHYVGLLKAVMRLSTGSLKAADAKEVAASVTAIANEKMKAEKEANAGKKKTGLKKKQLLVDKPDDDLAVAAYDDNDDYDFM